MQTTLSGPLSTHPQAQAAAALLRSCVHCGFCTATCPTYQVLGDELDGPRGRLYLIKQVLEGHEPTRRTQLHLDRCLTCRACETSCPSGVQYGRIVDIGRQLLAEQPLRSAWERTRRRWLVAALTGRAFAPALALGRLLRPLLPSRLRARLPRRVAPGAVPRRAHARRVLLLEGCVQPALAPNINACARRVLDRVGVELSPVRSAGCCGAIAHHLDDIQGARALARRNVDAWWPQLEKGAEAIVMTASGCATQVREYGHLLAEDPVYAQRAARVSACARDLVEVLEPHAPELLSQLRAAEAQPLVFHPPCSLQHGLALGGRVEALLRSAGADLRPFANVALCCGSAGTYSLLQPQIATTLRDRKLADIQAVSPQRILSANIGCITHLAAGTTLPVQHWIEWLDERLR